MRDPERINQFLDLLKALWHTVPDWRFLQLIENVFGRFENNFTFYIEDDQAIERLKQFFEVGKEKNA